MIIDKYTNILFELCKGNLYLVGGLVRDSLLNRKSNDYDFVTGGDTLQISKELATLTGGTYVLLDTERQTGRVVWKIDGESINFDIARYVGNSLEEDLKSRDFTINSMAKNLKDGAVVDPCLGIEDLKRGIIRTVNKQNLINDPLRMIRAFRLAAKLGFHIEPETLDYINSYSHLVSHTSAKERILKELYELLSYQNSYKYLVAMKDVGLLVDSSCEYIGIYEGLRRPRLCRLPEVAEYLKLYERLVKIALFTHNSTDKYALSSKELKFIHKCKTLVFTGEFTRSDMYTYFDKCADDLIGILLVQLSRIHNTSNITYKRLETLLTYYLEDKSLSNVKPILSGKELMSTFNLNTGKQIGDVLKALKIAQVENIVCDYDSAIKFVGGLICNQQ